MIWQLGHESLPPDHSPGPRCGYCRPSSDRGGAVGRGPGPSLKENPADILTRKLLLLAEGLPAISPSVARRILEQFRLTGPASAHHRLHNSMPRAGDFMVIDHAHTANGRRDRDGSADLGRHLGCRSVLSARNFLIEWTGRVRWGAGVRSTKRPRRLSSGRYGSNYKPLCLGE